LKGQPRDLVSWHQKFFHQVTLIRRTNVHIGPPSVTTYLLWKSPSSTLGPHYMVEISISRFGKTSFMTKFSFPSISDQESSTLPCRPASPCNCWVIIAKPYQVVSCLTNLGPFIILSSLKPMENFVHWIRPFVHAPLVHCVTCLHVIPLSMAPLSQSLHW
jgi:hypothetical protein